VRIHAHVFLCTDAELIYGTFLGMLYFRKKYFSVIERPRAERREALDGLKESFFEILEKRVGEQGMDVLARRALLTDLRDFLDLDSRGT
jgi:hypothetical protein